MKSFYLYIVLSLLLIFLIIYFYIKNLVNSIEFDFNIEDLNLSNLFNKKNSKVNINLCFFIKFISLFNISLTDLNIKVFYKNQLVASSSNSKENIKKIVLLSDFKNKVCHEFDIQFNSNTIDLYYLISNKLSYSIDYYISFKILNLTIKYNNKYENN